MRRKPNIAPTYDDDDDALLNAAITSVAQERSELANTVAHFRSTNYSRKFTELAWFVLAILGGTV